MYRDRGRRDNYRYIQNQFADGNRFPGWQWILEVAGSDHVE